MKNFLIFCSIIFFALAACNTDKEANVSPDQYWDMAKQDSVMLRILPYLAKLPRQATHETKFNPIYEPYYKGLLSDFKFKALSLTEDGSYYFMMDRTAPSLYGKRIAVAGKLKVDLDTYKIEEYEEVFWTFKLKEPVLTERSMFLFKELIAGKSLEAYLPMNSEEEYIEFPDLHNVYNAQARKWEFLHAEEQ